MSDPVKEGLDAARREHERNPDPSPEEMRKLLEALRVKFTKQQVH